MKHQTFKTMPCEEHLRLMIDYRDAVRRYVQSVELRIQADSATLRRASLDAWQASEKARVALAMHEAKHHCCSNELAGEEWCGSIAPCEASNRPEHADGKLAVLKVEL